MAVTGAAHGIGLAIARTLTQRGALLALGDLDAEATRVAAADLGPTARAYELDVRSTPSLSAFLEAAERDAQRPLDVLVNNAGIMWVGPFEEEDEAVAQRQLDVNFHGAAIGMRLAAPAMRARGAGHIVNIVSAAGRLPSSGQATYSAAKHALYAYSAAVRDELRGSGVEVTVLLPATVDTRLSAGTAHGRTRRLDPQDIAQAVLEVLIRPRFEVFVPRSVGPWSRLLAALPERPRDALAHALMPDQLADTDRAARAEYESRHVK